MTIKKFALAAAIALSMSGCGGGSDDSSSEPPGGGPTPPPPSSPNLDGTFKSSEDTGIYFSSPAITMSTTGFVTNQYGRNGSDCVTTYSNHYYELGDVLVFGNPDLPDSDYTQVADWIDKNFDVVLGEFGMTRADYFDARNDNNTVIANTIISQYPLTPDEFPSIPKPEDFDDWEYPQIEAYLVEKISEMDAEAFTSLVRNSFYSSDFPEDSLVVFEDKLYVCLVESDNTFYWGEGTPLGISVNAPSYGLSNDVEKLIKHELVHTIQHAVARNSQGLFLPRWFTEGQAVYHSGMDVASKGEHGQYEPTSVVFFTAEYGDPFEAYRHYGLAYQYLFDANGLESIKGMMSALGQLPGLGYVAEGDPRFDGVLIFRGDNVEHDAYRLVFDESMVKADGTPLTVDEYRQNYHSLVGQ